VNNRPNYSLLCLPTPMDYLGGERKRLAFRIKILEERKKELKTMYRKLEYKYQCLNGLQRDLKAQYKSVDLEMAEQDGRYEVQPSMLRKKIKRKKVKDKETSIKYTQEQVAGIAAALGIEI